MSLSLLAWNANVLRGQPHETKIAIMCGVLVLISVLVVVAKFLVVP